MTIEIVSSSRNKIVVFHSKLLIYQKVNPIKSYKITFNHNFSMVFLWFSYLPAGAERHAAERCGARCLARGCDEGPAEPGGQDEQRLWGFCGISIGFSGEFMGFKWILRG